MIKIYLGIGSTNAAVMLWMLSRSDARATNDVIPIALEALKKTTFDGFVTFTTARTEMCSRNSRRLFIVHLRVLCS